MDYHTMKRKELQALCKKKNIPANLTNVEMANKLISLIKGTGKSKAPGPSCLKNPIEVMIIEASDIESKPFKKVKFTPQNELFEFTSSNPRDTRRITRRRSIFVNNPVRDTRTRAHNLLDNGLVSSTNHPVEKEKGSESKEIIAKTDELKLPTRSLLRKREIVQNDAVSTQNHAEDEERFECNEEIVKKVVRTTRSRAQGEVNDAFVSITNPPVEKKKGSKSRKTLPEINEVKLPPERLVRNRKVDKSVADSIQDRVEDAERFEPSEEIVNNPVRVTRSRTESSVDEGLASTMNPPVKLKSGRKSVVEITKIDKVKLPTKRLLRNKVVQNDAVTTQNHAEDDERFERDEEIVNKVLRTTRSRVQVAVIDGFPSIVNPPVEKKKGSRLRNAIAAVDEVILPTKRLLRNKKVDQNDADSIQDQVKDAEKFKPSEKIVNNPVRVTRSRTESSVDEGLASTMNPPVQMKTRRKSIVEITKIDEVKLPTRRFLRNRDVVQNDAITSQSRAEDEERFERSEEIVNKVVRTTRSRAQGSINDGFVLIMNPPVEKIKGSKSRNVVATIDEVMSPTKRLLRKREVDQNDADSIQDHIKDTETFEPNVEIVNNPVRVTRSRTESSVDEGLASTMSPPVKTKSGRKLIVQITKIDEAKLPTRRLSRNREVKESIVNSIQSHIAKKGRKRTLDNLQEPQCVTVLSDDNCDSKEKQSGSVSEGNGGKRQTSGRYNRRKTVVSQLTDEEKVENPKAAVVDGSDVVTSSQFPNLVIPDGAEEKLGVSKRNGGKSQTSGRRNRRKTVVSQLADEEKLEYPEADIVDSSDVITSLQSSNLENPDCAEEKLDEILVQDYATEELEDGSTAKAEGSETEKDETHYFVNIEEMLADTDEKKAKVKVCPDINQASFTENSVAGCQEANDTAKYVEISPAREFLECKTSSIACTEYIREVNEMKIGKDTSAFVSKNIECVKNDIEVIEEDLNDKDYQETVVAMEGRDKNEKDACVVTCSKDNMGETFIEDEQVVRSYPCEEQESSSDEILAEAAISLNKENEGLKEIEQDKSLHDTVEGVNDDKVEESVQGTLSCEVTYVHNNVIQNFSNMDDSVDREKLDVVEVATSDDNLKLTNHEGAFGGSIDTSKCDSTEGEHVKLQGENDANRKSAVEEHGEKPHLLMEETVVETVSLHDNVVLEHPVSASDGYGISKNVANGIVQELTTCSPVLSENHKGETEEMCKYENEHTTKVACEATIEENGSEGCAVLEQGDELYSNNNKLQRPTDEEDNGDGSNERWHEELKILFATPVCENRTVRETQNVSFGKFDKTREKNNDEPTDSSLHLEQEMMNQDTEYSNAEKISEIVEATLKIVEKVEFIEENKNGVEDSTICFKDLDNVAGTCIYEEGKAMVEFIEGKLNVLQELVQDGDDFNAFTGSIIRKFVEQVEVVEVDKSNARQSETENVDENQSSAVKANETKSIADVCFEDEELNNMFATPMVNHEIKTYNVVKSNNIKEIMESAFRSVERLEVIDENKEKTIVEEITSEVDLDTVTDTISMEANTEVKISKEPKLQDSLLIGECGDLHIYENQISVITDDTAEPEITTENMETKTESEVEETVSVAEGADNSVAKAGESNVFIHVAVQDEQLTPVDSSFFHDQETENQDTNEILQNCGEFDAYTDWAATTFAENIRVDEFQQSDAKEAEIDCEVEQPPSVAKVSFNSEAIANVSDGFFDLAVDDEQLLSVDSSFFHDQEMVNQEIDNKMIKENSNDILQLCGGFNTFTGSTSNAQETELETGHERALGVLKGAENSVAISDESNEFFHIAIDDNSSSLHDKEIVNQETDDKMSEEFTNLAPKSVQEVQELEENKTCIVDEFIFEDGVFYNQDPLKVLDEDTENLNSKANDVANLTNNELGLPEFVNIENTRPVDEIEISGKLLTDSFENQVGDTISEFLEDKVSNNVEEDQQMWEEKSWSEGNNLEEEQLTWEEKDWSEVNIFDDIQGDFDGIANGARDTRKSSNDAADVLSEDGEVNEFDEVIQSKETALSVANGEGEVKEESKYESVRKNQTSMRPNDKMCYSTTMKVKIKSALMNATPNKLFADMKENDKSVKRDSRTGNVTEAKGLAKRRALGQI